MKKVKFSEQLFCFLKETIKTILETHKIAPDLVEKITEEVVDALSFEWGGVSLYIPKNMPDITKRDKQIMAEFNGMNIKELVKKYNLSEQWIYKILGRKAR